MDGKRNNNDSSLEYVTKSLRLGKVSKEIMSILKEAGDGLNAQLLTKQYFNMYPHLDLEYKSRKENNIKSTTLKRLCEQKLIWVKDYDGQLHFGLTTLGEKELEKRKELFDAIDKEGGVNYKKWDKKWRVVIFDVPEKKRRKRDSLRKALIEFGFMKLQQSVWVSPHECKSLVMLIRANFKLGKEVQVMTVTEIEDSDWLKKKFNVV